VPVSHVTNGVHMPSWDSPAADDLWTNVCGKDRWLGMTETLEQDINSVSAISFWQFRNAARTALVHFTRERLAQQLAVSGASIEVVDQAKHLFDPNILTLGFARRFATYKRPNLLLHDPERLLRILTHSQQPVQLIIAGKAHPADKDGQALIQEWMHFIHRPDVRSQVVFLSDYDMHLTEHLVQGVDVWLNTPQRPWEACGTSGMKVLVNGGINLSELDGWWAEAYSPELGWAIGDGLEHGNDSDWNRVEAEMLYDLLEQQVIPDFYARDEQGIPAAWVARIRESMAQLTPRFSADRTVREYTELHYLPAAADFFRRKSEEGLIGKQIAAWHHLLADQWSTIRFGEMKVDTSEKGHVFQVHVYLNQIGPCAVHIELYAEASVDQQAECYQMTCVHPLTEAPGSYLYHAEVPLSHLVADYTARVVPFFEGVGIPLENARILWQR